MSTKEKQAVRLAEDPSSLPDSNDYYNERDYIDALIKEVEASEPTELEKDYSLLNVK